MKKSSAAGCAARTGGGLAAPPRGHDSDQAPDADREEPAARNDLHSLKSDLERFTIRRLNPRLTAPKQFSSEERIFNERYCAQFYGVAYEQLVNLYRHTQADGTSFEYKYERLMYVK